MLSFKELSEKKKTNVLINPKKKDLQEKNHGEDCDCPKCEKKRRSEDVNDGPDIATEEACGKGMYYCHDDKKCKPIPEGYKEGKDGMLVKEAKVDQGKDYYAKMNDRNQRTFGNRRGSKKSNQKYDDTEARRYNTEKGRGVKTKGKKDKTPVNYHKRDSDKAVDELLGRVRKEDVSPKERFKRDAGAIAKKKMRNKEHRKYVNFLDVDENTIHSFNTFIQNNKPYDSQKEVSEESDKESKVETSLLKFSECWKTHKKVGMKMKGGKLVNDCRPKNEEVQVTEGSEKSYYLDKDAEKRAQQKARFKAQNKQAAKERAAAKRRKERNDLRRQGKYGAVGGYYVTKHMEREEVEPKLMSFSEMCCGSVKPVMKTVKPMMKKNELMRNIKKEEAYIKNNTQNIYGSQEEVSEKSDQSITETKTSLARFSDLSEVTRQKKEMGYVKGGTKKPTAPKQKDTALDFVKKQITAKYGKGAIMSGGSRQSKKVKGEKSTVGTGKYKKAADQKKQTAADAKKRGFKSTQDYVNTMARYGGKKNYDSGRGLGT